MVNSLYAGASGMIAQQTRIDALAGDIANVNTTGYKSQQVSFRDLIYQQTGAAKATTPQSRFGAGAAAEITGRTMAQGGLESDGNLLHLAIQGEGFFQVRLADGRIGLTRDGSFKLDAQRRLTTQNGQLVVPQVRIPADVADDQISISQDGTVTAANRAVGRVAVVTVDVPQQLASAGTNAFVPTENSGGVRPVPGARVVQGALETSNVDVATSMSSLIEAQRAYELNSRVIRTADELMSIATQIRR